MKPRATRLRQTYADDEGYGEGSIPATALLDEDDQVLLDENGQILLDE